VTGRVAATGAVSVVLAGLLLAQTHKPAELFGTWRGTSICADRVAAPACADEQVIYEFTAGSKAGTVHWKADKLVNGRRESMGDLELAYDEREKCWAVEFRSPRVSSVWCVTASGNRLTGTAWLLPGKEIIRRVDVRKDPARTTDLP